MRTESRPCQDSGQAFEAERMAKYLRVGQVGGTKMFSMARGKGDWSE